METTMESTDKGNQMEPEADGPDKELLQYKHLVALHNYFDLNKWNEILEYIQDNLSAEEILNLRFDKDKKSLMHKICISKTPLIPELINCFKSKLSKVDFINFINNIDEEGNPPLFCAVFIGKIETVQLLIDNGAQVNIRNFMGLNVMHIAAQGDKANMIIYFKEKYKFSPLDRDFPGNTPLHWACHSKAENAINFLLSWMNNINIINKKGETPLYMAIFVLRPKYITKLLKKGADVNIKDFNGVSVLDVINDENIKNENIKHIKPVILETINKTGACDIYQNSLSYPSFCNKSNEHKTEEVETYDQNYSRIIDEEYQDNSFWYNYKKISFPLYFTLFFGFYWIIVLFSLLPDLNTSAYYYLFFIFIIAVFVSFYLAASSNPGFVEIPNNFSFLELVEKDEDINSYCPYCKIKKNNDIKHCHVCNRCIVGFDHHCKWINNCVGQSNINHFVIFIIILSLNLAFNIYISLMVFFNPSNTGHVVYGEQYAITYGLGWIFGFSFTNFMAFIIFGLGAFLLIPLLYVLWFQIKNRLLE